MFEIICNRCGETMRGKTEYDAENLFTLHKCTGMRPLSEMPPALLLRVASKELTEAEAWILADIT